MKRRQFIINTSLAALSPFVLSALSACNAVTGKRKPVFVFIQLIGGNDGLNTLIPLNNYKKIVDARPNIFIPENKILPIKGTSINGLHPSMEAIRDLYDNNLFSFVQGVGYENPSYSHFRSADIYLTGSTANQVLFTGWMARYLETVYKNFPAGFPNSNHPEPPAIKIGDTGTYLFQADKFDMSIVIDPAEEFLPPDVDAVTTEAASLAKAEVAAIRNMLLQTKSYAPVLQHALATPFKHSALYPPAGENPLADQLKLVAQMIHSGIETPVYMVDLKGFDTHDDQADDKNTTKGQHSVLLSKLSQAIACFWDDVEKMNRQNDVAGMAFSEFGRRIMSNASRGTDHGSAQPLMFFGAGINPGIVGQNPVIPDVLTVNDNLKVDYDFRAVYAAVLKDWFKAPGDVIAETVGQFDNIPIFKS